MNNQTVEKIEKKRDIQKMWLIIQDVINNTQSIDTQEDILLPGSLTNWWIEPLSKTPIKTPQKEELRNALAILKNINTDDWEKAEWSNRYAKEPENLGEVGKELGSGNWVEILLNSEEESASSLIDIIKDGNPCSALIAAVVLHKATKNKRKNISLTIVAKPLFDLYQKARDLSPDNRRNKWMSKYVIPPRGDLWEWVSSHITEYGNRLEPLLRRKIKEKIENHINPSEFYILADLIVFHSDLSDKTYRFIYEIINKIITSPENFKWLDPKLLALIFKYSKKYPTNWEEYLRIYNLKEL